MTAGNNLIIRVINPGKTIVHKRKEGEEINIEKLKEFIREEEKYPKESEITLMFGNKFVSTDEQLKNIPEDSLIYANVIVPAKRESDDYYYIQRPITPVSDSIRNEETSFVVNDEQNHSFVSSLLQQLIEQNRIRGNFSVGYVINPQNNQITLILQPLYPEPPTQQRSEQESKKKLNVFEYLVLNVMQFCCVNTLNERMEIINSLGQFFATQFQGKETSVIITSLVESITQTFKSLYQSSHDIKQEREIINTLYFCAYSWVDCWNRKETTEKKYDSFVREIKTTLQTLKQKGQLDFLPDLVEKILKFVSVQNVFETKQRVLQSLLQHTFQ